MSDDPFELYQEPERNIFSPSYAESIPTPGGRRRRIAPLFRSSPYRRNDSPGSSISMYTGSTIELEDQDDPYGLRRDDFYATSTTSTEPYDQPILSPVVSSLATDEVLRQDNEMAYYGDNAYSTATPQPTQWRNSPVTAVEKVELARSRKVSVTWTPLPPPKFSPGPNLYLDPLTEDLDAELNSLLIDPDIDQSILQEIMAPLADEPGFGVFEAGAGFTSTSTSDAFTSTNSSMPMTVAVSPPRTPINRPPWS